MFRHGLAETGLFDDEPLARLLDAYPAELYDINLFDFDDEGQASMRTGARGRLPGREVLEGVKQGRIWVQLRRAEAWYPELGALIARAFAEIAGQGAGLPARATERPADHVGPAGQGALPCRRAGRGAVPHPGPQADLDLSERRRAHAPAGHGEHRPQAADRGPAVSPGDGRSGPGLRSGAGDGGGLAAARAPPDREPGGRSTSRCRWTTRPGARA